MVESGHLCWVTGISESYASDIFLEEGARGDMCSLRGGKATSVMGGERLWVAGVRSARESCLPRRGYRVR